MIGDFLKALVVIKKRDEQKAKEAAEKKAAEAKNKGEL